MLGKGLDFTLTYDTECSSLKAEEILTVNCKYDIYGC